MNQLEMAVIGMMIRWPAKTNSAFSLLLAKMFTDPRLGAIFNCLKKLHDDGRPVDDAIVSGVMGPEYAEIVMMARCSVMGCDEFDQYAALVLDAWRERDLKRWLEETALGSAIKEMCADEITGALREKVLQQEKIVSKLRDDTAAGFLQCVVDVLKEQQRPPDTLKIAKWDAFNLATGGLRRKGCYVVVARPGKGKSAFALQMAVALAMEHCVTYMSMEMDKQLVTQRILSRVCCIEANRFRDHQLTDNDQQRISIATDAMGKIRLDIDDGVCDLGKLEAKIAKDHPDVIFLDHIGLMGAVERRQKTNEELTDLTRGLKRMAMQHDMVIVELVQAGRSADTGHIKMSDMFGSASIEHDADAIIAIEPEAVEGNPQGNDFVSCDIRIIKNRHGITTTLPYHWQPQYQRFVPVEEKSDE